MRAGMPCREDSAAPLGQQEQQRQAKPDRRHDHARDPAVGQGQGHPRQANSGVAGMIVAAVGLGLSLLFLPATPLLVRDRATPARPPHTQASWCRVSEAAKADDLMSSPISCCTVESRASLARTWPNAATRATASAAASPKNIAPSAVTTVEAPSIPNMMTYGLRARSAEPSAVPAKPPSVAAASSPPSATLSFTPWKCTVLSRNARKNTVKPENARRVALARIASATTGPTWRSVRSPGLGDGRARPSGAALPAAAPPGTAPPGTVAGAPSAPSGTVPPGPRGPG